MNALLARIRSFFRKRELDRDLDAELAAHLDLATDENIRRGMSAAEARRAALLRFGGVEPAKELHRETRGLPLVDSALQDIRYTLRTMRRDAAFTVVALLILAVAIGANTAVFSVVNTLLLRPLPFRDPGQLVWLEDTEGHEGLSSLTFPVGVFEAMRSRNHSFQDMTAYNAFFGFNDFKLTGRGEPERWIGLPVAENFFPMLGVQPSIGRLFVKEEYQKNGRNAALLSHTLWSQRFGADPAIVGQSLTLNNQSVTVVGVLPASFDFGAIFSPGTKVDFYFPVIMDDIRRQGNVLSIIGRLRPGVPLASARAEFAALAPALRREHPEWYATYAARLSSLKEYVSGKVRRSLIVVWCAVGLILLIASVNLANLLLARSASRSKEFAIRNALGAARSRIVRQLLTESFILACGGAALGLLLAFVLTRYLAHSRTIALPLLQNVRVDGSALAFTILVTAGAALLFGLAPGLKAAGGGIHGALKESARGASEARTQGVFRAALVVSEIALACVLLAGAGVLLRSFLRVLDVDLGFQPGRAIALRIDYNRSAPQPARDAYFHELLRRAEAVPGIERASITDSLPLGENRSWGFRVQGKFYAPTDSDPAFVYVVAPGYLKTMGMRLLAGRSFTWHDTDSTEPVILMNEAAARRGWLGQDALGKMAVADRARRVIGIVGNVRETSLEEQAGPEMFLPITQARDLAGARLILRTSLPTEAIAAGVRAALRSVNPNMPVQNFQPLQQLVDRAVSPRRFIVLLVTAFALLGLLLASLGIYGVISYSVSRQTQEIGIRLALGASAGQLQLSVIARTLRLALIGIAAGTIGAFAVTQWIASLLFNVSPTDPVTFTGMVLVLALVSSIAGYIPARRASSVDPMIALRAD
ncbi:MAG: ABC transporter permease [Bryobacteraceae bacterium]